MGINIDIVANNTYEFKVIYELLGQVCLNRFTYVPGTIVEPVEDSDSILERFVADVLVAVRGITSNDATFTKILFQHLGGTEGTVEKILVGYNGLVDASGGNAPTNICASYRLYGSTGISRSGWKRMSGVLKVHVDGNVYDWTVSPNINSGVTAFKAIMVDGFLTGEDNQFLPALLAKTPEGGFYGNRVTSVSEPRLGSQNTRKVGHGD